ncbi:hypothetical protein FAM19024_002407 [Propionibacterium freudenreichii]|uniref:hypothetical protein n=1 Tax=Propionibacterium freudenreichii TaxID=1744 RepID=UPI0024340C2C|nr:hypothetical protein [Propionibacterium freudenreichii]WFF32859.1 hypothetical protein FAM19024_002407 [Propionibacterium freudenreichii]
MTNSTGPSPKAPKRTTAKNPTHRSSHDVRAYLEGAADFPAAIRELMRETRETSASALVANDENLKRHHDLQSRTFAAIEKELEKPDVAPADRRDLIDLMVDLLKDSETKDTENKGFIAGITQGQRQIGLAALAVTGAVVIGAVAGPEGLKQAGKLIGPAARRAITS